MFLKFHDSVSPTAVAYDRTMLSVRETSSELFFVLRWFKSLLGTLTVGLSAPSASLWITPS